VRSTPVQGARKTRRPLVTLLVAAITTSGLALAVDAPPAAATPTLPSGFLLQDIQTGLRPRVGNDFGDLLTDFAFLPDGSLLSAGKNGKVAWADDQGHTRQVAQLTVTTANDLGLIGLAIASDYATSHTVYTARAIGLTGPGTGAFGVLRFSSWTATVDAAGVPTGLTNEQTLLQTTADSEAHGMTGVVAANDGTLWLSVGDSGDWRRVDVTALRAGNIDDPHGKLYHLMPDGSGVPTNPYYDPANPRATRSQVYASGFRSPFRFTLDPTTGRPILGDVGWNTTEEINVVSPGNNYGWPCWEGNARTPGYSDLPECATATTATPIVTIQHPLAQAIVGGVVYGGTAYPEAYRGRYFFGDYTRNKIWSMSIDAQGQVTTPPEDPYFGGDLGSPVKFGAMPTGGDIVFADIYTSTLRRLVYAPGNAAPTAKIKNTVDPTTRTVTFDASGSEDPNGDTLGYAWAFGDGTTGTGVTATHTYAASPDNFTVKLTATDPLNASGTAFATVYPGNFAPALTVQPPDPNHLFAAGETITASATATDREDGPLSVHWTALIVHCRGVNDCHDHPGLTADGPTFSMTFDGHPGQSRLEITAVATDSKGATTQQTFTVLPKQRRITIQSNIPAGFTIGDEQTSSGLFTVGMTVPLIAPASALDGVANFSEWADGSRNRVRNLVLPDADQVVKVTYITPIDQRYATDLPIHALLGSPTSVEQGDSTMRWREYTGGRLYWTPAAGVHEAHGDILRSYLLAGGQVTYGAPVTDETPTSDGNGRFNDFQNGSFYWYPGLGASGLSGDVLAKYRALGAERSILNYPVANQGTTADGGTYAHFKGGVVYWNPGARRTEYIQGGSIYSSGAGTFEVHGLIRQRWAGLGWERSYLGYPASDEFAIPGGRRTNFQHGWIEVDNATGKVTDHPS
jgi:glucose/arabinose dehydrogenase